MAPAFLPEPVFESPTAAAWTVDSSRYLLDNGVQRHAVEVAMAGWVRHPLAQWSGGYDAAVELSHEAIRRLLDATGTVSHTNFRWGMPPWVSADNYLDVGDTVQTMFGPRVITSVGYGAAITTQGSLTASGELTLALEAGDPPALTLSGPATLVWRVTSTGFGFGPPGGENGDYTAPEPLDSPSDQTDFSGSPQRASAALVGGTFATGAPTRTNLLEAGVADGSLTFAAPLKVVVSGATVSVDADQDAATASFDTTSTEGQYLFANAVSGQVGGTGIAGPLRVTPVISLVGEIVPGETPEELTVEAAELYVLDANAESPLPCLAVGFLVQGGARDGVGPPANFVGAADFASIISDPVAQALCAYRWGTGQYPRIRFGRARGAYRDNTGEHEVIIVVKQEQLTYQDDQGNIVAWFRPFSEGSRRPEDYLQLGGQIRITVSDVLYPDGTPVPDQIKETFILAPEEGQYRLKVWLSVPKPSALPDPEMEAYAQAFRDGVTRYLSRPFAGAAVSGLFERSISGPDQRLLSRGQLLVSRRQQSPHWRPT